MRREQEEGPAERLVAFVMEERAIPRAGMTVLEGGEVTSGRVLADARRRASASRYVPAVLAEPGSTITIDVRGRPRRARVVRKPIYTREES